MVLYLFIFDLINQLSILTEKQQQHDISVNSGRNENSEKSESQMGFEPGSNPIWDSDFSESSFLPDFMLNIMLLLFLR